ncbi:hypothetical protein N7G274_007068 [Stereocaulon virgatum]|uniref:GATA-type domain-containing protein n=1 Tax=Stereocaulon virgatum TaxID=373712 RepID=A0ABR4A404_9LECA
MSQALPSTTDRIQEFYAPRPAQRSRTPQQQPMPHVQPQHTQRHIQLADITKRTRPEPKKQTVGAPTGSEFESFWSWIGHFMGDVRVKASTQHPVNDARVNRIVPARSHPAPAKTDPNASKSTMSIATSAVTKAREAEETAKEDLRRYKVERYSLWGELSYIHKSRKVKRAKKKTEAAMRDQREAAQRAREKGTEQQVAPRPDAASEELSRPEQRPTSSSPSPSSPRPPQTIDVIPPDERLPVTRKPTPAFSKNEGSVAKHAVEIIQPPDIHKSVHLTKTATNNYRVQGVTDSILDYKRRSSNVTTWGDFMRSQSSPPQRLSKLPPHIPTPLAPHNQAQDQPTHRTRNASAWTFTIPGQDDDPIHTTTHPISPTFHPPPTTIPSILPDPHVCALCGTLNSPKTHYNALGIWLCSACRSPVSAKEVPPPPATPGRRVRRYGTRSGVRGQGRGRRTSARRGDGDDGEGDGNGGHFSEPEDMRRSMKPAPLRSFHQRSASANAPVSPLFSDPFARFDSETEFARDMGRRNEGDFRPPPLRKDEGYIRKGSYASSFNYDYDLSTPPTPANKDAPLLSSKAFKPPTVPKTHHTPQHLPPILLPLTPPDLTSHPTPKNPPLRTPTSTTSPIAKTPAQRQHQTPTPHLNPPRRTTTTRHPLKFQIRATANTRRDGTQAAKKQ